MKKQYEVTGAFAGMKKGEILEADAKSVEASGLLGITLKEVRTAKTKVEKDEPERPVAPGGPPVGTTKPAVTPK
jgi:hypothetical protein